LWAALNGIPGVLRFQHGADLVPLEDRVPLLEMTSPSVARGSWVRIRKRGRHMNDLGLVYAICAPERSADVLLVPRIQLDRKRKRQGRPPAALFNEDAVKEVFGEKSVVCRNLIRVFKKELYKRGLVEKTFALQDLSDQSVYPTPSELALFRQSGHDSVAQAMIDCAVHLHVGDRIRVVAGTFQGLSGRLLNIGDHGTAEIEVDDPQKTVTVLTWEIRRFFLLGDAVKVHDGEHSGVNGFIVHMDDDSVIIYVREVVMREGEPYEQPGHEVRFVLFY
jgi:ribosomal protein L24